MLNQLRKQAAPLAVLFAHASAISPHAAHATLIDQVNSAKDIGLVRWAHFFQNYLDALTTDTDPANFDSKVHICWLAFQLEQWAGADVD